MRRLATRCAEQPDRRAVLSKATIRAADRLGLTGRELAAALGLSPATITRLHRGEYLLDPGQKSWELATLVVRLARGLDTLSADDDRAARAWFDHHNEHLQGVPRARIATVQGLVETMTYVDAFRARV